MREGRETPEECSELNRSNMGACLGLMGARLGSWYDTRIHKSRTEIVQDVVRRASEEKVLILKLKSFTPIRVPAGTKNSRPVGFLR